jgi:predicted metal-dependent phosphoesterase TrpH
VLDGQKVTKEACDEKRKQLQNDAAIAEQAIKDAEEAQARKDAEEAEKAAKAKKDAEDAEKAAKTDTEMARKSPRKGTETVARKRGRRRLLWGRGVALRASRSRCSTC